MKKASHERANAFPLHLREISGTVTVHKDRKQACGAGGGGGRECIYLMRTVPTGEDITNVLETGGGDSCQQCGYSQCH